jgi:hypothetical protein
MPRHTFEERLKQLKQIYEDKGKFPKYTEILDLLNMTSKGALSYIIDKAVLEGYIEKQSFLSPTDKLLKL